MIGGGIISPIQPAVEITAYTEQDIVAAPADRLAAAPGAIKLHIKTEPSVLMTREDDDGGDRSNVKQSQ